MALNAAQEAIVIDIEANTKPLHDDINDVKDLLLDLQVYVSNLDRTLGFQLNMLRNANKRAVDGMAADTAAATASMAASFSFFATYNAGKFISNIADPINEGLQLSVEAFSDFEQKMTETFAIGQVAGDGMRRTITNDLKELASTTRQTPVEMAEGLYYLTSAGYEAEAALSVLPEVAQFATAGLLDMREATMFLVDAQAALGMRSQDPLKNMMNMRQVSDAISLGAAHASAEIKDFSRSLSRDGAAAARQYGLELKSLIAILSAYSAQGIKGQKAGGDLGRSLRLIGQAYRKNSDTFAEFGIRVVDETTGQYRDFIDVIADMEVAFKNLTGPQRGAALEMLGIKAMAQRAITPLIGMSDQMKIWRQEQENAMGYTASVANDIMESFQSQVQVLTNNLNLLGIEVGEILAPSLQFLNGVLRALIDEWMALDQETKQFLVWSAVVVSGLTMITGGMLMATAAAGLMAIAVTSLWGAFVAAAPVVVPILAVVGAMGALAVAVAAVAYSVYGPEGLSNAWEQMQASASQSIKNVVGFFTHFEENWEKLTTLFREQWDLMLRDAIELTAVATSNIIKNFGVAFETILRLGNAAWIELLDKGLESATAKGTTKALKILFDFSNMGQRIIQSVLMGGMIDISEWMWGDVKGVDANGFEATAKKIIDEQVAKLHGLSEGFKPLANWPEFNLENKADEPAQQAGEEVGKAFVEGAKNAIVDGEDETADAIESHFNELLGEYEKFRDKVAKENAKFAENGRKMSDEQAMLSYFEKEGLPKEKLDELRAMVEAQEALEKQNKIIKDAEKTQKEHDSPAEKFRATMQDLNDQLKSGALTFTAYENAAKQARKELDKTYHLKFEVQGVESIQMGTAEAIAAIYEYKRVLSDKSKADADADAILNGGVPNPFAMPGADSSPEPQMTRKQRREQAEAERRRQRQMQARIDAMTPSPDAAQPDGALRHGITIPPEIQRDATDAEIAAVEQGLQEFNALFDNLNGSGEAQEQPVAIEEYSDALDADLADWFSEMEMKYGDPEASAPVWERDASASRSSEDPEKEELLPSDRWTGLLEQIEENTREGARLEPY